MAKSKKTDIIALECTVCKHRGYTKYKSKDLKEKLEIKKFCSKCKKHTMHKEVKMK